MQFAVTFPRCRIGAIDKNFQERDQRRLFKRARFDFFARLHMIRWQILAALALVCSTGGCHLKQLRQANEDLERENFQLEQRLDELTWQLEDTKAALQTCQNTLCATEKGGASSRSSSEGGPTSKPRRSSIFSSPSRQNAGPAAVDNETERRGWNCPTRKLALGRRPPRAHENVPRYSGPPVISPPDPQIPDGVLREPPRIEEAAHSAILPASIRGAMLPFSTRQDAPHAGGRGIITRRRGVASAGGVPAPMAAPGEDAVRQAAVRGHKHSSPRNRRRRRVRR